MKKIYRFVFAAALVLLFAGVFTGAAAAADTMFTGNADNAVDSGSSLSPIQAWAKYQDACKQVEAADKAVKDAEDAVAIAEKSGNKKMLREAQIALSAAERELKSSISAKRVAWINFLDSLSPTASQCLTQLLSLLR